MQVSRYQLTVTAIITVLLDISVLWICVGQGDNMRQRSALRQDSAEVTGKFTHLGRAGVRYTFIAYGGTFSGSSAVPPRLMRGLEESSSIGIRYLPSNPAINHPAAWEWSFTEGTSSIFDSVFLGAMYLMILLMLNWAFYKTVYLKRG